MQFGLGMLVSVVRVDYLDAVDQLTATFLPCSQAIVQTSIGKIHIHLVLKSTLGVANDPATRRLCNRLLDAHSLETDALLWTLSQSLPDCSY